MKNPSPKNLKDLLKLITPPKGVKRGKNANGALTDKANKLYDCDGDEMGMGDHQVMMRTSKLPKVLMLMNHLLMMQALIPRLSENKINVIH